MEVFDIETIGSPCRYIMKSLLIQTYIHVSDPFGTISDERPSLLLGNLTLSQILTAIVDEVVF